MLRGNISVAGGRRDGLCEQSPAVPCDRRAAPAAPTVTCHCQNWAMLDVLWESRVKRGNTTVWQQLGERGERWERSGPEGTKGSAGGGHLWRVLQTDLVGQKFCNLCSFVGKFKYNKVCQILHNIVANFILAASLPIPNLNLLECSFYSNIYRISGFLVSVFRWNFNGIRKIMNSSNKILNTKIICFKPGWCLWT